MPESRKGLAFLRLITQKFRTTAALWLGVTAKRKEELYLDLSRAATLRDASYWLQILFSAGIATLGLVLNSPAVIIGAMLISPLMSPILAAGLAFSTGGLVLGLRSVFKLFLSSALAIGFAVLLVVLLPFREMTSEITARTQPNTLDLLIALFSGAVGSIATCRKVKGVVTSIPGVAIAVALMPPLCVAGYGIGLAATFDGQTGMRIAGGGALLFLTNLVAITFTAMLVLLALEINTPRVRRKTERWEQADAESRFVINSMRRFPRLEQARKIHSLPLRFAMILIPLGLIFIPLSRAFTQLQTEILQKQQENAIRQKVTDLWQKEFQNDEEGKTRSTIDQLTISERDDKLNVYLRVIDDNPYTVEEKTRYTKLLAENLAKPADALNVQLVEVPTTSLLDRIRKRDEKQPPPPTVAELQANLWQQTQTALSDVTLPPDVQLIDKQVTTSAVEPLQVKLVYLSDTNLNPDTQNEVVQQIHTKLNYEGAKVSMERIPVSVGEITFLRNRADIPILGMLQLDFAGRMLRENPSLLVAVAIQTHRGERAEIADQRFQAISNYLQTRWQIAPDKIKLFDTAPPSRKTAITFQTVNEQTKEPIEANAQAAN